MMYYSAHWEIRQMIFWTSSLCLYTNSSTSSTATEKKRRSFDPADSKSPVEKKNPTKTKNSSSSRAMCGRVRRVRALRSRVQSSHMDTLSAHTRKKRKKISRPCTVSWLSAENCFSLLKLLTVPVQVQLISFYPPPKKKKKISSWSLLYKWH